MGPPRRHWLTISTRFASHAPQVFSKVEEPRLYILTVQGTQAVKGGWGLIYALEPMPSSRCAIDCDVEPSFLADCF